MTAGDKAKSAAKDVKGKVKEATGKATGHDRMRMEGKAEQREAHARHAAAKAKTTTKNVGKEIKGKGEELAGAITDDNTMEVKGKAQQVAARGKEHLNK